MRVNHYFLFIPMLYMYFYILVFSSYTGLLHIAYLFHFNIMVIIDIYSHKLYCLVEVWQKRKACMYYVHARCGMLPCLSYILVHFDLHEQCIFE